MKGRIISDNKIKIKEGDKKPVKVKGKYDKLLGEIKTVNVAVSSEENIPAELQNKDAEKNELKLLEYQLKNKDASVNQFLLDKYTEGNFNKAIYNGYDNSKKRIDAGVEYEYHVYYPYLNSKGEDPFADKRPPNFLISTKELIDFHTNDSYYYHFSIYEYDETRYKLDYTNELVNKNGIEVVGYKGLFNALNVLSDHINNDNPRLSNDVYHQLQKNDFVDKDGKLRLDIPEMMVSKYFKSFKNEKKNNGMEYLNNIGNIAEKKSEKKEEKKEEKIDKKKEEVVEEKKEEVDEEKKEEKVKKDNYTFLATYESKNTLKTGMSITNEDTLIKYCKAIGAQIKLIEQSGVKKNTGRIPLFLMKDDKVYLLFLQFNAGIRSFNINELISTAETIKRAQYSLLSRGYLRNSEEIKLLSPFMKEKRYGLFIKTFSKGKTPGFIESIL